MPELGRETFAGALSLHAGGGGFITAAYFAALGHPAHLAATLPAVPFDASVRAALAASDVDAQMCLPAPPGADPQVTVAMSTAQDRAFLTRRTGPAAGPVTAADMCARDIGHVHVGELATLTEMPGLIDAARAAGATISADCGWDDTVDPEAGQLIARLDVFLPNEAEAAQLSAAGVDPGTASLLVTKKGAAGSEARSGERVIAAPAVQASVIDTTGAGDAFNAGFLSSWLAGQDTAACLARGNACGAAAVAGFGGTAGQDAVRGLTAHAPSKALAR